MISKKAEYAINILAELARRESDKLLSSQDIAGSHDIPITLVAQLVSKLQKNGLIVSSRGARGGIRLAVKPENITLKQVVEIFDGPIGISRCLKSNDYCRKTSFCPLHQIWKRAQEKMLQELEQTNILELAQSFASRPEYAALP